MSVVICNGVTSALESPYKCWRVVVESAQTQSFAHPSTSTVDTLLSVVYETKYGKISYLFVVIDILGYDIESCELAA